ncbi:hypothetical protein [Pseudomonas luteola]|uniref:hypothetical protein n=1 Tax=Pseudomonas luteola TaxID=47886 RepID=UPI0028A0F917|nr:hypothetical protein [Pseudomonas luteola]
MLDVLSNNKIAANQFWLLGTLTRSRIQTLPGSTIEARLSERNGINNYSLDLEMAAVRKLGLGFLVTGVLGQLSALLWTYTSTGPICQNNVDNSYIQQKVKKFEQLLDDTAHKVATELSTKHSYGLAPFAKNEYRIPDSTEADAVRFSIEKPDEASVFTLPSLPIQAHKWPIILSGLITFTSACSWHSSPAKKPLIRNGTSFTPCEDR